MGYCDSLKKQLETSGITNYKTDSNILSDFIFSQIYPLTEKIKKEISVKNWIPKRGEVKKKLCYNLGLKNLPPRTPLNAKIMGIVHRDNYFIEKVIFETFKGIFVPAHLYIPKHAQFPFQLFYIFQATGLRIQN